MKQACLYVDYFYLNNRIFDLNDPVCNRDNCMYHYWLLKEELKKHDIDLVTQDLCQNPIFTIYNDIPHSYKQSENDYLIIWESEIIKPLNWNKDAHKGFKKIFTWYPKFRDDKYIRYYWPIKKIPMVRKEKTEFLCIINGRKSNYHYKELYSERQKAIEHFGNRIHVYGHGFNPIPNKLDVLSEYKFAICFENAIDIDGYITEKIWDCLQAGTIPIYLGAESDIPCIRFNGDYKALDQKLSLYNDEKILKVQQMMSDYLDKHDYYTSETWVKRIIENILQ